MTPKLKNKVNMNVIELHGQGISPALVLEAFQHLKAELEALDCEVTIQLDGKPMEMFSVVQMPESEVQSSY